MLRAFGHRVAMCCNMLGVVGSNLTIFKFEPTTPNMSQHIATGRPNARNMLRPTMLRYVALACCVRLAGALKENIFFGVYMPRPNDCNMPTQHVATLLAATCCVRLATVLDS